MFLSHWRQRPRILWVILVGALIGVDQLTKTYFSNTIALSEAVVVTDWFNFVHTLNRGAAFPFLQKMAGNDHVDWHKHPRNSFYNAGLYVQNMDPERRVGGLVVAGGASNLIDRIQTGAVVDFLDVHWRGMHWPAFNLADSYIVCAVLVWILLFRNSVSAQEQSTTAKVQA